MTAIVAIWVTCSLIAAFVWALTYLARDAHRQSLREPGLEMLPDLPVEPTGWTALDDHQLDRLLREAARN